MDALLQYEIQAWVCGSEVEEAKSKTEVWRMYGSGGWMEEATFKTRLKDKSKQAAAKASRLPRQLREVVAKLQRKCYWPVILIYSRLLLAGASGAGRRQSSF
jgi:hypothetical protein